MSLHIPAASDPFHVLSVEGGAKSGKTELVTKNAPAKIALYSTDNGWDGVIQKQDDWESRFLVENYIPFIDLSADMLFADGDEKEKEEARRLADKQKDRLMKELWQPFKKDYLNSLTDPAIRLNVWDFADEFNSYLRLVHFGKIEKNPQINSGPINAEMQNLIRQAHKHKKSLALIHQIAQSFKTVVSDTGREKSVPDPGKFYRRGNDSVNYLVHSFIKTHKIEPVYQGTRLVTEGRFEVEILSARLNPEVNGMRMQAGDWPTLMMLLAPKVPPEAWL